MREYCDHLKYLEPKKFRVELSKLDAYKTCDAQDFSCGKEKHVSEFSHRQRTRLTTLGLSTTVDVDPRCKRCMNQRRKAQDALRDINKPHVERTWTKAPLEHSGPQPGTPEHRFFCT